MKPVLFLSGLISLAILLKISTLFQNDPIHVYQDLKVNQSNSFDKPVSSIVLSNDLSYNSLIYLKQHTREVSYHQENTNTIKSR
ncbi:hypothetical protein SAMN04487906_1436 [Zhouia amylolytica]|uniref:Uncharacterized protein n=1 Tax=Zhouia amylolytica TaxID=376730 RepID=A0A1I6S5W4_9FLAO|nr:hypothetical protein [Zhouia amylolytica]MCQ0111004.1 hypothetical protein [Zhouia amylolytica]SFS72347.1 hypothetical protein SAMN04487906_1436 [Zhouia amylolytica]